MIPLHFEMKFHDELSRLFVEDDMSVAARNAGADICELFKDHFQKRATEKGSRNYWARAKGSVESQSSGQTAEITVGQKGVKLHWLGSGYLPGGVVKPSGRTSQVTGRPITSLLIPFDDSPLRKRRESLKELGIPEQEICVLLSKNGHPYLARVEDRKRKYKGSKVKVTPLGLLLKSVKRYPDPSVMPTADEMAMTVRTSVVDALHKQISNRLNHA